MASANFLEEALSTDVDESAVNAIMGSLENQLVPSESAPGVSNQTSNVSIVNESVLNTSASNVGVHKFGLISTITSGDQTTPKQVPLSNFQQIALAANKPNSSIGNLQGGSSTNFISHITNVNQPITQKTQDPLKIICQNATQNVSGSGQNTLLPNVQIVNMRPTTPVTPAQKTVATVSPRVVIGNATQQVMNVRGGAPGLTLQSIPGLQPGQQGHLLLKTENGQYQLLRVGPAPTQSVITTSASQLRLSVPATNRIAPQFTGAPLLRKTILQQQPLTVTSTGPTLASISTGKTQQLTTASALVSASGSLPLPSLQSTPSTSTMSSQQQGTFTSTQKLADNAKEKCRNFLANLLDLSSREPKTVERNVRVLIQELIDSRVEPEQFCDRLEKLLNASPQPCLIAFLKKSLPLLRESLVSKELVIDGIQPPVLRTSFTHTTQSPQVPMVRNSFVPASNVMRITANSPISVTHQNKTQQPGVSILNQTTIMPPQVWPATSRSTPGVSKPGTVAVLQNIPVQGNKMLSRPPPVGKLQSPIMQYNNKATFAKPAVPVSANSGVALSNLKSIIKEREKRGTKSFVQSMMDIDKISAEDDINDVTAMGGVNLAEETQMILGSTEMIGSKIRGCKDEYFAAMGPLQSHFKQIAARHGLDEPTFDLSALVSHAVQKRLQTLVEKLAIIAEHRIDLIKLHPQYEVSQDVRGQLKFLGEIDRVGRKRREDSEREILLRAAKSRSKTEDPEQVKLKAKAKEMQRVEMEELRQREANLTALQAIGTRKKPKLGDGSGIGIDLNTTSSNGVTPVSSGRNQKPPRSRLKRVNYRDMIFLLEQERDTCHSTLIYKCYLK